LTVSQDKQALLVCSEKGDTLKGRPCASVAVERACAEESISGVLEHFGYKVVRLADIHDSLLEQLDPVNWLHNKYQLAIVSLQGLDEGMSETVGIVLASGIHTIYVGHSNSMPPGKVLENVSRFIDIPTLELARKFGAQVPFLGCYVSLLAFLIATKRKEKFEKSTVTPESQKLIMNFLAEFCEDYFRRRQHGTR
jgi:hypothetical protein